jgi:hypothetical protein
MLPSFMHTAESLGAYNNQFGHERLLTLGRMLYSRRLYYYKGKIYTFLSLVEIKHADCRTRDKSPKIKYGDFQSVIAPNTCSGQQ